MSKSIKEVKVWNGDHSEGNLIFGTGDWSWKGGANFDIVLKDGTVIKKGDDISKYLLKEEN